VLSSTSGTFLRLFTFGHVRQLDAVAARLLTRLATAVPLLPGIQEYVLVDIDDTVRQTYGFAKQGAGRGYTGVRGLNALLAVVSTTCSVITVMTARPATALPEDGQESCCYSFEPKPDGWRCIAFHRGEGRVVLQSRRSKPLTTYSPEIATTVGERVSAGSVLDGPTFAIFSVPGGQRMIASASRRSAGSGSSAVRIC
jgi:hypothetical protein